MTSHSRQSAAWYGLGIVVAGLFFIGLTRGDDTAQTDGERAYAIKETTLCPICDGQNVLESNAPIATSIRALIDELVANGDSDAHIRARLATDFGADVNAIPPSSGVGALVWILPVAAAVLGVAGILFSIRRWRSVGVRRADADDATLVELARQNRP